MKKLLKLTILFFSFLLCTQSYAQTKITIMSINTEWFWDNKEPHEGVTAIGPRGNPPTKNEVNLEAFCIAQIIQANKANIVGLIEVENKDVVDLVRSYLPEDDWSVVFRKGRDTYTGQDVAILTRFDIVTDTPTNFGNTPGQDRPSKLLGVGINVGSETMYVMVTHLISQRSSNDTKRLNQATYIRSRAVDAQNIYNHVVIMGDMNDLPGTPPLIKLRGLDNSDATDDYIQTAVITGADAAYSYIYNNNKQLIDHILLSPSLKSDFENAAVIERHKTIDLGPISDHRAVMVNFNIQ